jgi:hypothetical protein
VDAMRTRLLQAAAVAAAAVPGERRTNSQIRTPAALILLKGRHPRSSLSAWPHQSRLAKDFRTLAHDTDRS